jgi:hypothetical protein
MKGKFKDLTGKKIGRLTVLRRVKNRGIYVYYLCSCGCGMQKEVRGSALTKKNATKSCGCLLQEFYRSSANTKNLKGCTFGSWKVTGTTVRRGNNGGAYWRCKCACGGSSLIASTTLLSGNSTQCQVCAGKANRKQFCFKGHDTHVWGRTSSQACRACIRDKALRTHYGITLVEYLCLYKKQRGRCAICRTKLGTYLPGVSGFGKTSKVEVDHDHSKSGRKSVRGLLCGRDWKGCNRKLGSIKSIKWLKQTLAYLSNPPAQKHLKETKAS